jgi:hypothetical protein
MVGGAGFGVSSARNIIAISSNFGDKKRCGVMEGRKLKGSVEYIAQPGEPREPHTQ